MTLAGRWDELARALPADWTDAHVVLRVLRPDDLPRAAALLGPLLPGRSGRDLRLVVERSAGPGLLGTRRLLGILDGEGIGGSLELVSSRRQERPATAPPGRRSLLEAWDESLDSLPADWSDLYCEVGLTSSDHLDPAALLLAPVNPARAGEGPAFRFRVARRFGYGASAQMARRCLGRLDENDIPGELRVLRVLSDTRPASTQGPVWYVGGKVV